MGYARFFYHILNIFLVLNPCMLDPDPYRFCLDPDLYQNSPWIRIHNEFFTSWIPISIKMIRIRHTASWYRYRIINYEDLHSFCAYPDPAFFFNAILFKIQTKKQ